jgi:hypothetical protein
VGSFSHSKSVVTFRPSGTSVSCPFKNTFINLTSHRRRPGCHRGPDFAGANSPNNLPVLVFQSLPQLLLSVIRRTHQILTIGLEAMNDRPSHVYRSFDGNAFTRLGLDMVHNTFELDVSVETHHHRPFLTNEFRREKTANIFFMVVARQVPSKRKTRDSGNHPLGDRPELV